jgi:hypothetical protein
MHIKLFHLSLYISTQIVEYAVILPFGNVMIIFSFYL